MSKRDRPSFLLPSFGQRASKFASETKFSGQLKASVQAEVTSVSGDSVFALFPCYWLRGESLQLYLQKTNVRVDLWQYQYALSGGDQVLCAWRTWQWRYGDLDELKISWQPVNVTQPYPIPG